MKNQASNESQSAAEAFINKLRTIAGVLFNCGEVLCESDGKGGAKEVRFMNGKAIANPGTFWLGDWDISGAVTLTPVPVRHTVKKEGDEWAVVCYVNGKRDEGRTYYASDKADAVATKDAMDQSAGLKA